jgi:hypothetical protein
MTCLSFIITCYKDIDRLKLLTYKLKTHYTEYISVVSDGDDSNDIKEFCEQEKLNYYYFDRSYTLESGFKFWRNVFEVYDKHPSEFLIKLDTDVDIRRKIILTDDLKNTMFGSVFDRTHQNKELGKYIQNGIRGFHKDVIDKIKKSKFYYDDIYFREAFLRSNFFDVRNRLKSRGMISTDFTMYAMGKLESIQLKDHSEILSYWFHPEIKRYFERGLSKEQFLSLIEEKNPAMIHPWYE